MFYNLLLLVFGVFCCATSVIFIKLSQIQPITLSSFRLLTATVFLMPIFFKEYRVYREKISLKDFLTPVWPAVILSFHFISWIAAARLTSAANASLIVNLVPLVMPLLLYVFLKEKIDKTETIATLIALAGVSLLGFSDFSANPEFLKGDILSFISMLFLSIYLVLGRKNSDQVSLWLYIVPLYFFAFCFCFVVALIFETPLRCYEARDIIIAIGLGLVPTVIGHTVLNYAMRHLRGQVVSIFSMFQFVFAGVMSYYLFNEVPTKTFYFVSLLLTISGILVTIGATGLSSFLRKKSQPFK